MTKSTSKMGKNKRTKKLEKKHTKLKKRHKRLRDIARTSINLLREAQKELRQRKIKSTLDESTISKIAEEGEQISIVVPIQELWLSKLLQSSNRFNKEEVLTYFGRLLNNQDITPEKVIDATPEDEGKNGKWKITYLPKKEKPHNSCVEG